MRILHTTNSGIRETLSANETTNLGPNKRSATPNNAEQDKIRKDRFQKFAMDMNNKPSSEIMRVMSAIFKRRRKATAALANSPESLGRYREHFRTMNINSLPYPSETIVTDEERIVPIEKQLNLFSTFHPSKLMSILKRISWRKAPGPTGISGDIFKAIGEPAAELLSRVFHLYCRAGCVPATWTRAILVPVPKKGDLNRIENYRPISLTEVTRKLFEHCLLGHMKSNADRLSLFQAGFQDGHCCNDVILTLNEILRLKKKEKMHLAFLDIKAAYDSVDRRILWRKCKKHGLCDLTIHLLRKLFDHNSSQFIVDGHRSELSASMLEFFRARC